MGSCKPSKVAPKSDGTFEYRAATLDKDVGVRVIVSAKRGDDTALAAALDDGGSVDTVGMWGSTAVIVAAQYGNAKCVALLVGRGADIERRNDRGAHALLYACLGTFDETLVCDALLEASGTIYNPVTDRTEALTPLAAAACSDNVAACHILLKAGARPSVEALLFSCEAGAAQCAALLLRNGAVVAPSSLLVAAEAGHADALDVLLLESSDDLLRVALAHTGGSRAWTALHAACARDLPPATALAQRAVSLGVSVDDADDRGMTPLLHAVSRGLVDVTMVLVEAGVSVATCDKRGRDAAALARRLGDGDDACRIRALVQDALASQPAAARPSDDDKVDATQPAMPAFLQPSAPPPRQDGACRRPRNR